MPFRFSRLLRGALVTTAALVVFQPLHAQRRYRPPAEYLQFGQPDPQEGRRILEEFRRLGIAGDYYLQFELRVRPRRGKETVRHGELRGTRNELGALTRVQFAAESGQPETRLLVQSGPQPAVWRWSAAQPAEVKKLPPEELFQPIAGTELTAFDLQMPFLHWPEFVFEGTAKLRGRPAYAFLFYPPAELAEKYPALTGVRAYLDTQFNVLMQASLIGEEGRVLKEISVQDFKRVGEQWLVKSFDLRDESTRNKTRLVMVGAALDQRWPREPFEPARLTTPAPAPAAEKISRL